MILFCSIIFIRAFPSDYDNDLYKLHLEALFKGLLVHLDDPSASIQVKSLLATPRPANQGSKIR